MTKASKRFVRDKRALVEASKSLRMVLQRYEETGVEIAARVERGEPGTDALRAAEGAVRRREVTDALEEFEAARRRVRLGMFALASEEGASISEVGRQLGISRQLAARLANEAKDTLS